MPMSLWCWIVTQMSVACGVPGCLVRGAEVPGALTVPVLQVDVRLSSWFSQGPLSRHVRHFTAGVALQTRHARKSSRGWSQHEVACGWPHGRLVPVILSLIEQLFALQWRSAALEIIQMFWTFVQSLNPESDAAQGLHQNCAC